VVVSVVIDKCSIECVGEVRGHDASWWRKSRSDAWDAFREDELLVQSIVHHRSITECLCVAASILEDVFGQRANPATFEEREGLTSEGLTSDDLTMRKRGQILKLYRIPWRVGK
jgi:hypothetical protein